jgi:hypothetical protein
MKDKYKCIPHFENEDEERAFWATHDSTEYIDWDKAEINPVFPRLQKSPQTAPAGDPD